MIRKFIDLVIGERISTKEYKKQLESINHLPNEYRVAFKQIIKYYETVGGVTNITEYIKLRQDLLDLFTQAAANEQSLTSVIGNDTASFANNFLSEYSSSLNLRRQKLNAEIKAGLEEL